ncbi:MAG: AIR synthase-related protein [Promethearchaeota archaeon]
MADLEGLARALLQRFPGAGNRERVLDALVTEYGYYKDLPDGVARKLAAAVVEECENSSVAPSDAVVRRVLEVPRGGVTIGTQGVGCRGLGDFFVHKLVAEMAETSHKAELSPTSLDDAGAVSLGGGGEYIVTKMEGMHSRLSDFPFLAGFHVTRAALRDLLVKGAVPVSVMVDVHLADDADVGKLFDFMGGVSAVCELAGCPITAGSTLRIGGDMVIGTRFTGGIAAVGLAEHLLARRDIQVGDAVLMTEGAGGGTIATTAIYSGKPDVVAETLNVKFLDACRALIDGGLAGGIHAMADVTNGGLRGDLFEIDHEAGTGVLVDEAAVRRLVNPTVLALLEETGTDYLGVSLDALLVYCPPEFAGRVMDAIRGQNVRVERIGTVNDSGRVEFRTSDGTVTAVPRFREAAYTPVKKEIGEEAPGRGAEREAAVRAAMEAALEKRRALVRLVERERGE